MTKITKLITSLWATKRLKDPLKWILVVIAVGLAVWYFVPLLSELVS